MKKTHFFRRWIALLLMVLLVLNSLGFASEESYSAGVMRLLNYEGEVRILDAQGNDRFIMENVRFSSGESLSTSHGAMASVGLDATKVLTLDSMTQVLFEKINNQMKLTLASGRLLLDVQEKLDENEAFEIETANMTVGIRGTIVFLTSFDGSEEEINRDLLESNATFRELLNRTLPAGYSGNFSQLVVLEGTAVAEYQDAHGHAQSVEVHAGEKITVLDDRRDEPEVIPAVAEDLGADMVNRIQEDEVLSNRVDEATDILPEDKDPESEPELPPEHIHDFTPEFTAPTCTSDGVITYRCSCGESFTASGGSALGHDWSTWSVAAAPTCTAEGKQVRTCNRCGVTEEQTLPATGHTPVTEPAVAATCTASGWTEYTYCSVCKAELSGKRTEVPALGHSWGEWQIDPEPTCIAEGKQQHTCARCGITEEQTLPATGHTPHTDPGTPATCTESGWTDHIYCEICETVLEPYQVEIPALGHDRGEWQILEEPSCMDEGMRQHTCARCGETAQEPIAATGHTSVTVSGTPATCTESGTTDYEKCSVCGQILSAPSTSTPALGHDWGEWQTLAEPSCTEPGKRQHTCGRCSTTEQEDIPTIDHIPVLVPSTATCTASGMTEYQQCSVCGQILSAPPTWAPALGHDWGEWEVITESTCTEPGSHRHTCRLCGETETEPMDLAAHSEVETGKPTCTDPGYEGRTICTVCRQIINEGTPAPALGGEHNYEPVGDTFSGSYYNEDEGVTMITVNQAYVCTRCGYGYTVIVDEWPEGAHVIDPGT